MVLETVPRDTLFALSLTKKNTDEIMVVNGINRNSSEYKKEPKYHLSTTGLLCHYYLGLNTTYLSLLDKCGESVEERR
jgi:hypothetical protein